MSAAAGPAIAFALLAAGGGSRFDGEVHKLLAPLGDADVFGASMAAMIEAADGLDIDSARRFVVTGAVDLGDRLAGVVQVPNPNWADGQASSVQTAIAAAAHAGCDRVVIGLADQPAAGVDAWLDVAAAVDAPIVIASFRGRRTPPIRLRSDVWDLLPTEGDEGARTLLRSRPDLVTEVACDGSALDVDTAADLAAVRRAVAQQSASWVPEEN